MLISADLPYRVAVRGNGKKSLKGLSNLAYNIHLKLQLLIKVSCFLPSSAVAYMIFYLKRNLSFFSKKVLLSYNFTITQQRDVSKE